MTITRTEIPDVVICKPTIFGDDRGYFCETFREDKLEEFLGFPLNFCQDNESRSSYGVLRGLHYQIPPFTQTKLVRVLEGSVLDIAIDIREGSPYFGQHVAIELSAENKLQLFVPRGFAHGFVVLSETATFAYKCDNYYAPAHDAGILFNDPALKIDWKVPSDQLKLSQKDMKQPKLKEGTLFNFYENLYEEELTYHRD